MKYLKSKFVKFSSASLKIAVVIAVIACVFNPGISLADSPLKPSGTAESGVSVWLPTGSVDDTVIATADYIAEKDLPSRVKYPPGTVGQAFTLGIWVGDGVSLSQFEPSIVINALYKDDDIPPTVLAEEPTLHLMMYNPTTKSWNKLCSSVDVHENVVSAALSSTTPIEEDGSSLFAIAVDPTDPLDQELNDQGITTITVKGSDLNLQVPSQAIENGIHFAVTLLPNVSNGSRVKMLSKPVDIKACLADKSNPSQNNRQVTRFDKLLTVGFEVSSDTVSRAGGKENLTIATLHDDRWLDVEEIRSKVERSSDLVATDTRNLGTFGLGAR